MAIKTSRKKIAASRLISSDEVNVRMADNYDLESLRPQVISAGRIIRPLLVEAIEGKPGYYMVLQGNRRLRLVLLLLADPTVSEELKEAINHLDCDVAEGIADDAERIRLIVDQDQKGLSRLEIVNTVWRMDAQMISPRAIGEALYYQLAQYTKNTSKLAGLAALKDPAKRSKYLATWFKGTLDQKILLAARLGAYVKQQFILTTKAEDGTLKEGETVEVIISQERLSDLSKARTADMEAGGWSPEHGGEAFNALLQQFRDIDAGRASKVKVERPTAKNLIEYATTIYRSDPIRAALRVAAGQADFGKGLPEMDAAIYRWSLASEILAKNAHLVVDQNVSRLIEALLSNGPAAEVEDALKPFFAAEPTD